MAKLDMAARKRIKKENFAIPEKYPDLPACKKERNDQMNQSIRKAAGRS